MSRKSAARPQNQGLKLAISAAAVAATLGGWAAFSAPEPVESVAAAPAVASIPEWLLQPPEIPALTSVTAAPPPVRWAPAVPARPAPITVTRSSR